MKILFVCSLWLLSATALADPTRPAPSWLAATATADPAVQTQALSLQLIKQTANGRIGVINGSLLRKGEKIRQYQLQDIAADHVVLELNGERQILRLVNTAIKQDEE